MHVLIIGAGLTGPALAIALARRSIRSTIFERRPAMDDIGGLIMLAPNAATVLDKIVGIEDKIRPRGYSFDAINVFTHDANALTPVGGVRLSDFEGGLQAISLSRPVLHEVLLDGCKEYPEWIDVKWGKKVERIDERDDGVSIHFEDGSSEQGDIVIGADGIGSKIRQHILGEANPPSVFCGSISIGSIVPRSALDLPSDFLFPAFLYTKAGTILIFAMDNDVTKVGWATTVHAADRDRKEWTAYHSSGEAVRDVKKQFAGMDLAPIPTLVDSLEDGDVRFWAPYSIPEIPTWHTNRCCILGDAAHAIPPHAGQGAAQGMEDVGLMALLLASPAAKRSDFASVFDHFERVRRKRVSMVRMFTDRAESTRGPTQSAWGWWLKRSIMGGYFSLMGKKGYIKSGPLMSYDVTKEDVMVL